MSGFRLAAGGLGIDRDRPVDFTFDGTAMRGFAGDTLASALLANGVSIVARSFKYHRPRGVIGTGFAETNALVRLGEGAGATPNVPATQIPLTPGLSAASLNAWPNVRFDLGRANDRVKGLLGAGFYYKSFMWPGWDRFEPFIRRAAGIGRAPEAPDPDCYDAVVRNCDVLVIGAGPAGLMAAAAAVRAGAAVILIEADTLLGAGLIASAAKIDGVPAYAWAQRCAAELSASPDVTILRRTVATGYYDHNFLTAVEQVDRPELRQRLWKLRARRVVLAGGAFERPLLFAGNDRPGVMLAGSVHDYIIRYGVAPGRRAVFATANDGAYHAAVAAHHAGIAVRAVVDARGTSPPAAEAVRALGIPVLCDSRVLSTKGDRAVCGVRIAGPNGTHAYDCDLVAMSGGWSPAVQLFTQSGGTARYDDGIGAFVPDQSVQAEMSCGAAAGVFALGSCLAGAAAAGRESAVACGHHGEAAAPPPVEAAEAESPLAMVPPGGEAKSVFVDQQTDVTLADMRQAVAENYRSPEHVKRYTVWAMGTDQGKLSAVNGVAMLAGLRGLAPGALGTTKFRPPFAPVAISAISAGRGSGALFRPWRRLPAHRWHEARGAAFEDLGFLRPSHYSVGTEDMAAAALREVRAVRGGVGMIEASTFGKIELRGPEAANFLDRVCAFPARRLAVGQVGYNLMLNELGTIIDDGVVTRLAGEHFLLTASSAFADRIGLWLADWHQEEWRFDCVLGDVTAQWAVLTLAGPKARAVLERADCSIDFAGHAFAHMSVRTGKLAGVPARIHRVSFTGEISYEIAVPAAHAEAMAKYLARLGEPLGLIPFGIEALDVMRIEKGHFDVGTDTDSDTRPGDVGIGAPARRDDDFLGRSALLHASGLRPRRKQLVGLQPFDTGTVLPPGAHVIGGDPHSGQGFVTSSCFSPTLKRGLALALLEDGHARHGETVTLWSEGETWQARVAGPRAFDPEGARQHG